MMARPTIGGEAEPDRAFLSEGEASVEDSGVLTSVEEKDHVQLQFRRVRS